MESAFLYSLKIHLNFSEKFKYLIFFLNFFFKIVDVINFKNYSNFISFLQCIKFYFHLNLPFFNFLDLIIFPEFGEYYLQQECLLLSN